MVTPLKAKLTFGEENPVNLQLHRFLQWEDFRQALPSKRFGRNRELEDEDPIHRKITTRLSRPRFRKPNNETSPLLPLIGTKQTFENELSTEQRVKNARAFYIAKEFDLPQWMEEDLDQRASPAYDRRHPWDEGVDSPKSASPISKSDMLVPKLNGKATEGNEAQLTSPVKEVKVVSPPEHLPTNGPLIANTTANSNSKTPQTATISAKVENHNIESTTKAVTNNLLATNKGKVLAKLNGLKSLSKDTEVPNSARSASSIVTSRYNGRPKYIPKGKPPPPPPSPKMTARQRVLKEFRDKRRPKKGKKYIPMSQRTITAPAKPERWDYVGPAILDDFHDNENWRSLSRSRSRHRSLSRSQSDLHKQAGANTRNSRLAQHSKRRGSPTSSHDDDTFSGQFEYSGKPQKPILKIGKSAQGSLHSFKVLPPISDGAAPVRRYEGQSVVPRLAGVGTPGRNYSQSEVVDAGTQAVINEVATNTEKELRDIGISTRDDVIYIFEQVDWKRNKKLQNDFQRRMKHEHRHHHRMSHGRYRSHHNRHGSSGTPPTDDSDSYSVNKSSSESETSLRVSPLPTRHQKSQRRQVSHPGEEKRKQREPRLQHQEQIDHVQDSENNRATISRSSEQSADEKEQVVSFNVRTWSGRKRGLSFVMNQNDNVSVAALRNKILNEVGIPKESVQMTVTPRQQHTAASATNSDLTPNAVAALKRLKDRAKEKLARSISTSSVFADTNPGQKPLSRKQSLTRTPSNETPGKPTSRKQSLLSKTPSLPNSIPKSGARRIGQIDEQDEVEAIQPGSVVSSIVTEAQPQDLEECRYCQRKFAIARLEIHEATCFKLKRKEGQRKVFDSRQARLAEVMANPNDRMLVESGAMGNIRKGKTKSKPKNSWRERHAALIEQIRYAKKLTEVEKAGGDISQLGPAPATYDDDLEKCPKCGRKFNSDAIKRHVPVCKAEPVRRNGRRR